MKTGPRNSQGLENRLKVTAVHFQLFHFSVPDFPSIQGPFRRHRMGGLVLAYVMLVSSTVLNLLVLLAIMLRYGRFVKNEP